jgi:hypothetical protein
MEPLPAQQPVDAKLRRNARLTLLVTSVLFGLLMIPGIGAVMISPMVFESAASKEDPVLVAFTVALVSYPVLALLSILGSWIAYALKRYRTAIAISLPPFLPILAALVCFLLLER